MSVVLDPERNENEHAHHGFPIFSHLPTLKPSSLYGESALSLHVGALFAENEILRLDAPHNKPR